MRSAVRVLCALALSGNALIGGAAAPTAAEVAAATPPLSFWTDTAGCHAPGKVLSAKVSRRTKADVDVKVKLKTGVITTSTVNNGNVRDFPAGSPFCAQDYSGD